MYTLNSETSSIPDILNEFLGEDEEGRGDRRPVSFLSDENEETASVQFLSTEGIAAPPRTRPPEEPEPEAKGFFRRALGQDSRPLHLITPDMIIPPSIRTGDFFACAQASTSRTYMGRTFGSDVSRTCSSKRSRFLSILLSLPKP